MTTEDYDLVILGSGEGSKFLAWTQARKGNRVAVIERKYIGGSCPNVACLPSKNVIHSSKIAALARRGDEFGVRAGPVTVDMGAVRERKRKMVTELVAIHEQNFASSGAELVLGSGRFVGPRTLLVTLRDGTSRTLRGTRVVIGTGTRATIGDVPGLTDSQPLTHVEALELGEVPAHLLVLGGGYVGLEFAQAMRRLGSRVTVLARSDRLLASEDDDAVQALSALFRDEGIDVVLGANITAVSGRSGASVEVSLDLAGKTETLLGTHLLASMGRTPNTDGMGLDLAGVELDHRGYVKVNEKLETTAQGVWAVGEVAGSPQFTHIAYDDFRVIRDNLSGGHRVSTGRLVPYCLFTDPELAHVGLSEKQALAANLAYRVFRVPMAADLRTRTLSETRGFMKALVAEDSDRILGFTVFGVDAGEIMSAVQLAMIGNLPYTAVRDAVIAHPTLMEGLVVLFSSTPRTVSSGRPS
jgi:pyruvate/2-oxoglutarate dehydrogenase complex dihydrolipoamide dehydrogenase (E3) component